MNAFSANRNGDVKVYAIPLSGGGSEIEGFLSRNSLGGAEILWNGRGALGSVPQHPVILFRKGSRYFRINGLTTAAELTRHFEEFVK